MEEKISLDDYKLSCELLGHSSDVRTVAEGQNNCILSGSRDKSVKIWERECNEKQYKLKSTLSHHKNFVSSILYMENEKWICTGSNDSTICIYNEEALTPFVILRGHSETVCTLAKGLKSKVIISGSWDKTARIWIIDDSNTPTVTTLKGHESAIWAVTSISNEMYVTGSADKTIIYWNEKGEKLKTLNAHKDCIRGLIGLDNGSLISCSNDAIIKYWNQNGECVQEFHGHTNFIYSIALNKKFGNDVFVSVGEDSTIRMWNLKTGILGNPIVLPVQSVWSVACLKNGDIVVGTSDGLVRIFSKDSDRFADDNKLKDFEMQVKIWEAQARQQLGGINKNDLPGPESLLQPGREGQTKIVRQSDGKVMCYQWKDNQWELVGDVMDASNENDKNSGKVLYEGKEYDYVFNVDISESIPQLKLPYNRNEDPWLVAQNFIHKNDLPQAYLEEIANFIIKNSGSSHFEQTSRTGFEDPFTGSSRYIPGLNTNNSILAGNADPFTGSCSYVSNDTQKQCSAKHFPFITYITLNNCAPPKILDKLKDFNKIATSNNVGVDEDFLTLLIKLVEETINNCNARTDLDNIAMETLCNLLNWPKDILFPVLDVIRILVHNEQVCTFLLEKNFLEIIIDNLSSSPANQLMCVRCIANMLTHSFSQHNVKQKLAIIINNLMGIKQGSSNLQIALATLYLNVTITQMKISNESECQIITEGILGLFKWCSDFEALYRCMQALGNLLCSSYDRKHIKSMQFVIDKIQELSTTQSSSSSNKIVECANQLLACL